MRYAVRHFISIGNAGICGSCVRVHFLPPVQIGKGDDHVALSGKVRNRLLNYLAELRPARVEEAVPSTAASALQSWATLLVSYYLYYCLANAVLRLFR